MRQHYFEGEDRMSKHRIDKRTKADGESAKQATTWAEFLRRVEEMLAVAPDGRDKATQSVAYAYDRLDKSNKMKARHMLEGDAAEAVMKGELPTAQALLGAKDVMLRNAANVIQGDRNHLARNRAARESRDAVEYLASVQVAFSLVRTDLMALVEERRVSPNWESEVSEMATTEALERARAYMGFIASNHMGEEPEASEVEKMAARLASRRSPSGRGRKPRGATATGRKTRGTVVGDADEDEQRTQDTEDRVQNIADDATEAMEDVTQIGRDALQALDSKIDTVEGLMEGTVSTKDEIREAIGLGGGTFEGPDPSAGAPTELAPALPADVAAVLATPELDAADAFPGWAPANVSTAIVDVESPGRPDMSDPDVRAAAEAEELAETEPPEVSEHDLVRFTDDFDL